MPETKHTPGPWTIDPPTEQRAYPIREWDGYLIATVWPDDSRREAADARLIAAAPDLLEALKAFMDAGSRRSEAESEATAKRFGKAFTLAFDAIAKVENKSVRRVSLESSTQEGR